MLAAIDVLITCTEQDLFVVTKLSVILQIIFHNKDFVVINDWIWWTSNEGHVGLIIGLKTVELRELKERRTFYIGVLFYTPHVSYVILCLKILILPA